MEFYILVILFWTPVLLVFIKDIVWNLYLWQNKEYRFGRMMSYILWDKEFNNKKVNLTTLKIICFALTFLFLNSPLLSIIGIFVAYVVWMIETFDFIRHTIQRKLKPINFFSIRNLSIFIIITLSLIIIIFYLSYPFIILQILNPPSNSDVESFKTFINNTSKTIYPSVYIYLSLSTLLGIFIDLASPIILGIIVALTSPIELLKNYYITQKFKKKLLKYRNQIKVISIIGSNYKNIQKEVIYKTIEDDFLVLKISNTYSSKIKLIEDIIYKLNEFTEIILLDLDSFYIGELKEIAELIQPDITLLTDIDIHHIGFFKNIREYLRSRVEIIEYMNNNGLLILNLDDGYLNNEFNFYYGKKVGYSIKKDISSQIKNRIHAQYLMTLNNEHLYKVNYENKNFKIFLPNRHILKFVLPALIIAKELSIKTSHIKDKISKLENVPIFSMTPGDNETMLIYNSNYENSFKNVTNLIKFGNKVKTKNQYSNVVFVISGFDELGKFKNKFYQRLNQIIKDKVDILITTDQVFYNNSLKDNHKLISIKVNNVPVIIYQLRKLAPNKSIILIEGKFTGEIIESLRSEE